MQAKASQLDGSHNYKQNKTTSYLASWIDSNMLRDKIEVFGSIECPI
jgi:hypothetical protein